MEANSKTQMKVGIFLVVGLVVIMTSIFMLGADRALFRSYIYLHAHFDQVQGLAEGSVISLSGVNVGNVERIDFQPETNSLDLVMKIDKKYAAKLTEGAQVEIRTQGALGDKFVFIIPGDAKAAPVKNGDVLEVAKATDILGIISERGKETEKVFDIINEILKMAKTINADNRFERIVSNMAVASGNLKDAASDAKKFSGELNVGTATKLKHSLERLDSILAKLDRGDGTLGALINDSSVHEQLKSLLGASSRKQHIKSMIRTSIERAEEK